MGNYVSLWGIVDNVNYLMQLRQVLPTEVKDGRRVSKFQDGRYPFLFPGALSMFGGAVEKCETLDQAFRREMREELPRLDLSGRLSEPVTYDFTKIDEVDEVYGRINEFFRGNVDSFLGFDLNGHVPNCALGNRGREILEKIGTTKMSYRDWLSLFVGKTSFFRVDINREAALGLEDKEGAGRVLVPYRVLKNITMEPADKLAALDHLRMRVEAREISIE